MTMWPRSTFTPVPSRPRFSVLPVMPTAMITRSTVISSLLPPLSMVAVTLSVPFFSALTVALVRILMPRFSNAFWAKAEISSSSTGSTRGSTSTTVTSASIER